MEFITLGSLDGPELDPHIYNKVTKYANCTVEILEDDDGNVSIGWYRQEDTYEIEET